MVFENWRKPWSKIEEDFVLFLSNTEGLFPCQIAFIVKRTIPGVAQRLQANPNYIKHSKGDFHKFYGRSQVQRSER